MRWIAAAVLVISVLPLACGSSEGPDANLISRSGFLAKARPICERGTAKIDKYYSFWAERASRHADSEEFMNGVAERIVIPVRTQEVRELRSLGLPADGEKKLKAFLAAIEEGIETGKMDRRTLRGGNFAFHRAYEMAADVGLQSCFLG